MKKKIKIYTSEKVTEAFKSYLFCEGINFGVEKIIRKMIRKMV